MLYSVDPKNKTNLNPQRYYKKRVLWTTNQAPKLNMKDRTNDRQNAIMNLPQHLNMFGPWKSLNETWYRCLFINWKAEFASQEW